MKNKYLVILGVITLILLAIAVYMLLSNNVAPKEQASTSTQQSPSEATKKVQEIIRNTKEIALTKNGFEPKSITISAGTRVLWTNKSGENGSVNSDPYPTNVYWKFLNLGLFSDTQSVSVTFEKAGKYTYHNQFHPEQTGIVIVQ